MAMVRTRRRAGIRDNERVLGWLLLSPALLYIVLLVGFPFILAIVYSFTDMTVGRTTAQFVGFRNYAGIMSSPTFWLAVKNTIWIALITQVFVVVLGSILAEALLKEFRGKWLVRLLILLPWVAPISLGTIGWLWMLDPIYSVFNWLLREVGWLAPRGRYIWLGQPDLAMGSIIAVNVWRLLPLATIIIIAGLSSIPQDIHDAAAMDGAKYLRRQFQITVPLVLPIVLVAVLFGVIFSITDLIVVYMLTRGGPYDSTQVIASWAYFTGIQGGDLGDGAAISLFLFPVLVAIAAAFLHLARRAEVT